MSAKVTREFRERQCPECGQVSRDAGEKYCPRCRRRLPGVTVRETRELSWDGDDPDPSVIRAALGWTGDPLADFDLPVLAAELARLREHLESQAVTGIVADPSTSDVKAAEEMALRGDAPRTATRLKGVGGKTLQAARDIGVEVAAAAIARSAGLS